MYYVYKKKSDYRDTRMQTNKMCKTIIVNHLIIELLLLYHH